MPDQCNTLEQAARAVDPIAKVWRGSHEDRAESQGIIVLGTPVGHQEFVKQELLKTVAEHSKCLLKIPEVKDLQCTRANFYLRIVRPELTEEFSQRHDEQIWRCFCTIAGVAPEAPSPSSRAVTSLPLAAGGLGLRSATRLRHVAHWASWADTIKMVHELHPEVAESILEAVEAHNQAPSIVAINNSVENLVATGFIPPSWEELSRSTVEAPAPVDEEPNQPRVGVAVASRAVESSLIVVLPTLSDPDIALLKSQGGPLASAPFVSFPTNRATRLEPQVLKVLFLRGLRLPLPLTARVCRCGRLLDVFGHHQSACAVA